MSHALACTPLSSCTCSVFTHKSKQIKRHVPKPNVFTCIKIPWREAHPMSCEPTSSPSAPEACSHSKRVLHRMVFQELKAMQVPSVSSFRDFLWLSLSRYLQLSHRGIMAVANKENSVVHSCIPSEPKNELQMSSKNQWTETEKT